MREVAVHKYELNLSGMDIRMALPAGANIIRVGMQKKAIAVPVMWAIVCTDAEWPLEDRTFRVYGTGFPMPAGGLRYVGTAQEDGLSHFVWHVFEVMD